MTACIPLTQEMEDQLSEYAIGVSHDNADAGLTTASAWCYLPGPDLGDGTNYPTVISVNSMDLLRYGSCEGILTYGKGSTACEQIGEGWFCTVGKE